MPIIEIKQYPAICSRCKKKFKNLFLPPKGNPVWCKECIRVHFAINDLEGLFIAERFALEKEDEKLVQQMNALLQKEKSGIVAEDELAVTELLKRLLKDEKKEKRILKRLLKLQRKKR